MEISIHEVDELQKYPAGIKYGLICKDLETGRFVLFDNHHPKGPHVHVNSLESHYEFKDEVTLFGDFRRAVFKELGVNL